MAIRTLLADRLGIEHPIVLAPMGSITGGRLAAAVSNVGGLGLVGGGYGGPARLRTELDLISQSTGRPWGVGLITWHAFLERWEGHEAELAASQEARERFQAAQADGDVETAMVWAGEAVDLIGEVLPAAEIVQPIVAQATACLQSAGTFLGYLPSV